MNRRSFLSGFALLPFAAYGAAVASIASVANTSPARADLLWRMDLAHGDILSVNKARHSYIGDSGPEAIMPLKRNSDGSLGVRARGMGTPFSYVFRG